MRAWPTPRRIVAPWSGNVSRGGQSARIVHPPRHVTRESPRRATSPCPYFSTCLKRDPEPERALGGREPHWRGPPSVSSFDRYSIAMNTGRAPSYSGSHAGEATTRLGRSHRGCRILAKIGCVEHLRSRWYSTRPAGDGAVLAGQQGLHGLDGVCRKARGSGSNSLLL